MKKEFRIRPNVLLASGMTCIVAILVLVIIMFKVIGGDGVGFLSAPFALFISAYCIFISSFEGATRDMVKSRVGRSQMLGARKNVKQLMIAGFAIGLVLSLLCAGLSYVISYYVFHTARSVYVLLMIAPSFVFLSIQGVIRGYLSGAGFSLPSLISDALLAGITVIVSLVLCNVAYSYGRKVDALMHVNDIAPAYGAIGAAFGISASCFVSLVFVVIMYLVHRSTLMEMSKVSSPVKMDHKNESVFELIVRCVITGVIGILLFVDECVYLNIADKIHPEEKNMDSWGIYFGQCVSLVGIAVFLTAIPFLKSWYGVHVSIVKKDFKAARGRLCNLIHFEAMLVFPVVIWGMLLAKTFDTVIFGKSITSGVDMIVLSIPIVIPGAVILFQSFLLSQLKNKLIMVVNFAIGITVHIAVLLSMTYVGGYGIHASIAAFAAMFIVQGILGVVEIKIMLDISIDMIRDILKPLLAAAVSGAFALLLDRILVNLIGEILTFVITLILTYVLYNVLLIVLRSVNRYEIERMPFGDYFALLSDKINGR